MIDFKNYSNEQLNQYYRSLVNRLLTYRVDGVRGLPLENLSQEITWTQKELEARGI